MSVVKHLRKVSANILAAWLEVETSELDYRRFPTEQGTFRMRKASVQRDKWGQAEIITIEGTEILPVHRQANELAVSASPRFPFVCIRFELIHLDDARTEITTKFKDEPTVTAYCAELLAAMEELWPAEV